MPLLRAERLTKSYNGRTVVRELTLEVRAGEIIGLLGRNGAGKTTTFQMMIGLVRPESGVILLDGMDISRMTTYPPGGQRHHLPPPGRLGLPQGFGGGQSQARPRAPAPDAEGTA